MNRNYLDEERGEQHFREMTNRVKGPETKMMMNPRNGEAVDKCIGWNRCRHEFVGRYSKGEIEKIRCR